MQDKSKRLFGRRKQRVRRRVGTTAKGRPRLSGFRSSLHIYAQVIDEGSGKILAAASTLDKSLREGLKTGANVAAAQAVGKLVAQRAGAAGGQAGVLGRGGCLFRGRGH